MPPQPPPPVASDCHPFSFACRCLNVKIDGRVAADCEDKVTGKSSSKEGKEKSKEDEGGEVDVFLTSGSEGVKFTEYVIYDSEAPAASREDGESAVVDEEKADNVWRKCCICDTKLYKVKGKAPEEQQAVEEAWVAVDLGSGIVYGEKLDTSLGQEGLPFSGLLFEPPATQSHFGRPPTVPTPSTDPDSYIPSSRSTTPLIPPPHDPFFLPPPFIPSHPHLRDLCESAAQHLREAHAKLEDDVRHFLGVKTMELRDLEERVRGEVEVLWEKYQAGPGKGEETKQRSASHSRTRESVSKGSGVGAGGGTGADQSKFPPLKEPKVEPKRSFADPTSRQTAKDNPILHAALSPSTSAVPAGTSLLAQSLSANSFYPPPSATPTSNAHVPTALRDEVDDTIQEVSRTYGTKGDSRAVAMSYVFSNLSENMGGESASLARQQAAQHEQEEEEAEEEAIPQNKDKDSWIDEETQMARRPMPKDMLDSVVEEDAVEGRTPRAGEKKLDGEEQGSKEGGKGKGKAVKFDEPEKPERAVKEASVDESDQEDYVFDFELDEPTQPPNNSLPSQSLFAGLSPSSRTRNMVEANLSYTFAADLPSHRAAWRRIEKNGSMYEALRRGPHSPEDDDPDVDEGSISKLATSVPIAIHPIRAGKSNGVIPPLQRKTSLSDRQGMLVPPLLAAMREKGVARRDSLGVGIPPPRGRPDAKRKSSRSASVSRERDAVQSYAADPGAAFESLADGDDDDEDEQEGTVRDKGFIPPHVLARKEDSKELPDVGWRSMAT
ncbi:hypothetical protein IAT38_004139 [Cryptococcus sp. DSM 104549]